jgi:hypothetical protein
MKKIDEWYSELNRIGCIVCLNEFNVRTPPDMHHIIKSGKRIDDFHTIPLCPNHHRSGVNTKEYVSRHPWKKEFEKRYGKETDLFEQVKSLCVNFVP